MSILDITHDDSVTDLSTSGILDITDSDQVRDLTPLDLGDPEA